MSSRGTTPTRAVARPKTAGDLDDAIERAQQALLDLQAPDGHWVGEAEANTTITSEYLLFCHLIERVDREREGKMVHYLRGEQLADGGFGRLGLCAVR